MIAAGHSSNKGNLGALHADVGDINTHQTHFSRAGFQGHRNFDVLDIVLRHGQNFIFACVGTRDHCADAVAATVIRHLEGLIYSTATFHGNCTVTDDMTIGKQLAAAIDRNGTSAEHIYSAHFARNHTVDRLGGRQLVGQTHTAVDYDVCPAGHRQRPVNLRGACNAPVGFHTGVNDIGCVKCIRVIKGDQ